MPTYYRQAVREEDLAPISDPEIDLEQVEDDKPLVFTATVEVRPRLELAEADYKGVQVKKPSTEVTDEEVDDWVDRLRERFAELEPADRPVRAGDFVTIDVKATLHGEEVAEAQPLRLPLFRRLGRVRLRSWTTSSSRRSPATS